MIFCLKVISLFSVSLHPHIRWEWHTVFLRATVTILLRPGNALADLQHHVCQVSYRVLDLFYSRNHHLVVTNILKIMRIILKIYIYTWKLRRMFEMLVFLKWNQKPVQRNLTTLGIASLTSDFTCRTISDSHIGFDFCFIDINLGKKVSPVSTLLFDKWISADKLLNILTLSSGSPETAWLIWQAHPTPLQWSIHRPF